MAFAIATCKLPLIMPYISQKSVPAVKSTYIGREIPIVFFVCMVLTACGKNEIVVPIAAKSPNRSVYVIATKLNYIQQQYFSNGNN